ncbi:MAG: UvrD-helicase domain-containing protein [Treponema sp.]|nr:UvrD-helicase domain-containing protein [Treponema sp.]
MKITADLHIHSRFSRATSKKLTPASLDRWARIKGIDLIGSGDCTHPAWLAELREHLEPMEDGFFILKKDARAAFDKDPANEEIPHPSGNPPRFVLTGEISTIYKKNDRTRKVHHVVILPSFETAARFQAKIEGIGGNIRSDGRPILGLDSRTLFALLLEADERALLIPAHIWTPWFSALGGKSGFDSIEECYGDLAPFIPAIETGLSSNPPMNWALSSLDRFSIISNSDAHSPEKLGREATVFAMELSFSSLTTALFRENKKRESPNDLSTGTPTLAHTAADIYNDILYTVEFYPQEGKYHYDGHRKCGVSQPISGNCPKCGKPLTKGVIGRVMELADRPVDEWAPCPSYYGPTNRRPYVSLIPLKELVGELLNTSDSSKRVNAAYHALVKAAGSELSLLIDAPLADIERMGVPGLDGGRLAEAVSRMRTGQVFVQAGFDGEYGVIRVFPPQAGSRRRETEERGIEIFQEAFHSPKATMPPPEWIKYEGGTAIIIAGPGAGKTSALTARIARLLENGADPAAILAITFTVKAARELKERTDNANTGKITAATFHSLCAALLREFPPADNSGFSILTETEREALLKEICTGHRIKPQGLGDYIEKRKRFLLLPGENTPYLGDERLAALAERLGLPEIEPEKESLYHYYQKKLGLTFDFDDLIAETARFLAKSPKIRAECQKRYRFIFVDEYQDVNFAQYVLLRFLFAGEQAGQKEQKLWVVGDPNQAIYGFRGSDKRFMDQFLIDYPTAARFSLTRSFRCAAPIIAAARALVDVELQSTDSPVEVFLYKEEFLTDKSEAEGVARRISGLLGGASFFAMDSGEAAGGTESASLDDIAILLRSAGLALPFVKALTAHGVPYKLTGEKPWWEEAEPASLLSALRNFILDGIDGLSLPEKRPQETVKRLAELRFGNGEKPPFVERLIETAAFYESVRAFLDALVVSRATDDSATQIHGVSIMTIHASKGLEFAHVFVPALEDGFLPFTLYEKENAPKLRERIEEEKRLLYVAMTRAKSGLYLSWAKKRMFQGRQFENPPSRFLEKLADLVPLAESRARRPKKPPDPQLELFL